MKTINEIMKMLQTTQMRKIMMQRLSKHQSVKMITLIMMFMKMNMMQRLSKVKMITIMKMSQTTQRRKIPVGRTETTPCPVLALKHHHLLLISLYKVLSVLSWL